MVKSLQMLRCLPTLGVFWGGTGGDVQKSQTELVRARRKQTFVQIWMIRKQEF